MIRPNRVRSQASTEQVEKERRQLSEAQAALLSAEQRPRAEELRKAEAKVGTARIPCGRRIRQPLAQMHEAVLLVFDC